MTSSLVGSEMCIRDSSCSPPPPALATGPGYISRAPATNPFPTPTTTPVSYTHLTLPTICSV
eukprot:6974221-Prorocentrum_lima.AAC.1